MLTKKEQAIIRISILSLLATAAMHVTFAATYLVYGKSRAQETGRSNAYDNQLPTASYILITAITMLAYCVLAYKNLLCTCKSRVLSILSWTLSWSITVMSFGVGVITANQYSLLALLIDYYKITAAKLPQNFLRQYNCLLGDAIITFAIGFPFSLVLNRFENYKRAQVTFEALERPEKESEKKEYRIQENINEEAVDYTESSN